MNSYPLMRQISADYPLSNWRGEFVEVIDEDSDVGYSMVTPIPPKADTQGVPISFVIATHYLEPVDLEPEKAVD